MESELLRRKRREIRRESGMSAGEKERGRNDRKKMQKRREVRLNNRRLGAKNSGKA